MNTVIHIQWATGQAELDLAAWFPAPDYRVRQLRKLLALEPETVATAKATAEKLIRSLHARKQQERDSAVAWVDRYRKDAAQQTVPKERVRLMACANREAGAARRAERDIRLLRRNAAAVKSWRF